MRRGHRVVRSRHAAGPGGVDARRDALDAPADPVLEGRHVRLEPLSREHHTELCDVGLDPDLWRWTVTRSHTPDQLLAYIDAALHARAAGDAIPFLIRDQASGRAIGSTRYGNIDTANRRLEIGWTWIAAPWQRTPANTEAKLLLLTHAFEDRGCIRVEFKTDVLNTKSRNALLRIGAVMNVVRHHAHLQALAKTPMRLSSRSFSRPKFG